MKYTALLLLLTVTSSSWAQPKTVTIDDVVAAYDTALIRLEAGTFVKGGQRTSNGFFKSKLKRELSDSETAMRYFRSYRLKMAVGLGAFYAGAAAAIGVTALTLSPVGLLALPVGYVALIVFSISAGSDYLRRFGTIIEMR